MGGGTNAKYLDLLDGFLPQIDQMHVGTVERLVVALVGDDALSADRVVSGNELFGYRGILDERLLASAKSRAVALAAGSIIWSGKALLNKTPPRVHHSS